MTTRQRTTRTLLAVVGFALLVAALFGLTRIADATTAAATTRADVATSQLQDVRARLAKVTDQRDAARTQRDEAATQRDQARAQRDEAATQRDEARSLASERAAALEGQYDVTADTAAQLQAARDEVADLRGALSDASKKADAAAKAAPAPRFYEDGSWVAGERSGCAPSALCDDAYQDSLIEHVPSGLATWDGFRVGEVILCPKGWEVSTDDAGKGRTWAACM